ncbi:MAG: hypothetical protein K2K03_01060, partial [Prevotella sp.]|nr:hypothetical protein [Prevotella sp.]
MSCKDYECDNYAELQEKYSTLEEAYDAQLKAMEDYVLLLDFNKFVERYGKETGYTPELAASKGTIAKRLEELEKDTASLAERIAKNNLAIAQAQALAESAKGLAERDSVRLDGMDALWAKLVAYWGDDLNSAVEKAAEVLVTVAQDSTKWNEAYDSIAKNAQSWNDVRDYVLAHQDEWNEAYDSIAKRSEEWNRAVEVADSAYNFIHNNYKGEFKNLQELIDAYKAADEALQEQIDDLKADVEKILKALRTEITGITVQAAVNPIFGSFAYPIDVQSNVLAAYYGEVTNAGDEGYEFPAGDEYTDIWASGVPAILSSELAEIKPENVYTVKDGILMNEGAGNAGKLYVTVNPSNVDFDGKFFTLRTSDNQVSKVTLSALEPCTEQLKWGYQRASANGFYVANAEIKKDQVKDVALSFNMKGSELAATVQSMMSDWSKTGIADVAKLAYTVANGMKADVPRLGVQAQWQDAVTGDWKNYVSKYDLAAFSVNPLGFDFLNGADYSEGIIKLKNQITAKEKAFSQELINMIANAVKVEIGLPESAGSIVVTDDGQVKLLVPGIDLRKMFGNNTNTQFYVRVDGYFGDGQPAYGYVEINTETSELDITSLFNAIKNGIEGSLGGINGTVNNAVNKVLNKIISVENKIFNKVASVAKNPNRFLQPALVAQSETLGYFYPSRIYFAPTQVKKGTKLIRYPTKLTGAPVATAFKKYVAVCGAWDVKDMNKTTSAK